MRWVCKASALKSFAGRGIASVSTNVVTLDTNYDPSPTDGLVANDLVQIYDVSAATYQNFTITSLTATTVTLSGSPTGIVAGDFFELRAATPSFANRVPFLWSRTQFCFADTAANALSAAHTPCEMGTEWEVMHKFEDDEGSKRSGSYDPASLPRLQGDVAFKAKLFFDTPEQAQYFTSVTKRAVVIRCFSETGYEYRLTINNIKVKDGGKPLLKSEGILYYELEFVPQQDSSDGQAFDVKVIHALSGF